NELRPIDPTPTPPQLFSDFLKIADDEIRRCIIGDEMAQGAAGDKAYATLATYGQSKKAARPIRLGRFLATVLSDPLLRAILRFNPRFAHIRNSRPRLTIKASPVTEGERLELMLRWPTPVLVDEMFELAGFTQPTRAQIQNGETIIPAMMAGGGPEAP